jgi:hypothetical protein
MTGQTLFLVIFVLLQALDVWTTLVALERGHREMNPVLAKAFQYAEPLVVMVVIKLAGVWALWWVDMYWLTGLMCAMYLFVVNNNLDVIQAKRK